MDLFDVVRACFRRWYILVPLLLFTGWYTHQAYTSVKPVYYSQAVMGLAPPSRRVDAAAVGQLVPRNGLLDIGGAPLLANMVAMELSQPEVVSRVVAGGGSPDYIVKMFPSPPTAPPLPLVTIEETAPEPEMATKTLKLVSKEMAPTLEAIQVQANVPREMMIGTFVVTPPTQPVAAMPTRTRSTATIAVAGIALTVLVTVVADILLIRLRRKPKPLRRSAAKDDEPAPSPANTSRDEPKLDSPEARDAEITDAADAR